MSNVAKKAARTAKNSTVMHVLARAGYVASGILHIIIGLIAIAVATGTGGGNSADQSGALAHLASAPGGLFLLWAAVVSLTSLGLWLLLSAFFDPSGNGKRKRVSHGIQNAVKGLIYLVLAYTAFIFAIGGTTSSTQSTSQLSGTLMSTPGGVIIVVVIGLALLGVGAFAIFKGATRRFERDIQMPPDPAGKALRVLGVVGYVARGVALGLVGVLFVLGAITNDPSKTTGLDGALTSLVGLPIGVAVLIGIGLGFIAYGIYAFFRARLARL